jgi:hypothetical protein
MSPILTAETTWITVRCPCRKSILIEIQGYGAAPLVRRHCSRCRGWWIVNLADGSVRGVEPSSQSGNNETVHSPGARTST